MICRHVELPAELFVFAKSLLVVSQGLGISPPGVVDQSEVVEDQGNLIANLLSLGVFEGPIVVLYRPVVLSPVIIDETQIVQGSDDVRVTFDGLGYRERLLITSNCALVLPGIGIDGTDVIEKLSLLGSVAQSLE